MVPFYFSGFIVKCDFAWENLLFGILSKKHGGLPEKKHEKNAKKLFEIKIK